MGTLLNRPAVILYFIHVYIQLIQTDREITILYTTNSRLYGITVHIAYWHSPTSEYYYHGQANIIKDKIVTIFTRFGRQGIYNMYLT